MGQKPHALQPKREKYSGSFAVVRSLHRFGMTILAQLASDDVLDSAYEWLCRRRQEYSANSDVWSFRRCWQREKVRIKGEQPDIRGAQSREAPRQDIYRQDRERLPNFIEKASRLYEQERSAG